MSIFPGALSASQYVRLRGDASTPARWSGAQYLSVCPNTVVYKTRIAAGTYGVSNAAFTVGSTLSGSPGAALVGMTVFICPIDNIRAYEWVGRIRLPVADSVMHVNENSYIPDVNDYVFVVADYRIWPKLARADSSGVQYKDYDLTFRQIPPVIVGLQTAYAGWVNSSGKLRIAFDISASYAATSGATLSTYAWTFPASATVVSGSTSSATVTIDFAESAGEWCSVTVTDSGGRTATRRFIVFSHGATYPPLVHATGADITRDLENGDSASLDAFANIDAVLDNTLCCVWREEFYNGVNETLWAGTNLPNNVDFLGRIRTEGNEYANDERFQRVLNTRFTLEGVAAQLQRIHGTSNTCVHDTTPSVWDEINNLTVWRAIVHYLHEHTTFLTLHDLMFDSTSHTFMCQYLNVQGQNGLSIVNDLAESINAGLEFSPAGQARIVRNANYLSTSARNALTVVANFDERDWLAFTLDVESIDRVGRVEASGGTFHSTGNLTTPALAIAPGMAQDTGEGQNSLTRQILEANVSFIVAQLELNQRSGDHLAFVNGAETLTVIHPDGYHWIVPSRYTWYTWAIAASDTTRGRIYTSSERWWVRSVQFSHDNERGTRGPVRVVYVRETAGLAGDTVYMPVQTEEPVDPISLLPADPFPVLAPDPIDGLDGPIAEPEAASGPPRDGNAVLTYDAHNVYLTTNFLATDSPLWRNVTPHDIYDHSYTVAHAVFDLRFNKRAFVLANDGTDSFVYTTADAFTNPVVWSKGNSISGVYTLLRTSSTTDTISVYTPDGVSTGGPTDYVVTFDPGGTSYTILDGHGIVTSGGNPGNCLKFDGSSSYIPDCGSPGVHCWPIEYRVTFPATAHVLTVELDFYSGGPAIHTMNYCFTFYNSGGSVLGTFNWGTINSGSGWFHLSERTVNLANVAYVDIEAWQRYVFGNVDIAHDNVTFHTTAGSVSGALVRFSSNNGSTWGSNLLVGNSPGAAGGFDLVRQGTYSQAAGDQQSYQATTLGGSYTDYGADGDTTGAQPILIQYPWFKFGSNSTRNNSAPYDFVLGSSALVSSHCLWRVAGSGGRTGITPSGVTAMVSPNCSTTWKGTKIAVIGSVSGTRKLFTSTTLGSTDTWTDRGAINSAANYIRVRRLSSTGNQLFFTANTQIGYSANFGATLTYKATPSDGPLLGVEAYG